MQSTKKLTHVLRDLLNLVEDEAARNPAFAARLEAITAGLAVASKKPPRPRRRSPIERLPDVFAEYQAKGEEEFRFWLRSLDLAVLKTIIKSNGFDPGKISQRWTDPDKLVVLITEQTAARLRRGSAFLPPSNPQEGQERP